MTASSESAAKVPQRASHITHNKILSSLDGRQVEHDLHCLCLKGIYCALEAIYHILHAFKSISMADHLLCLDTTFCHQINGSRILQERQQSSSSAMGNHANDMMTCNIIVLELFAYP